MPRPDYEFRGGKENGRPRRQHEFTFRARPPPTSARPLLSTMRGTTPEFHGGAEGDQEQERKFLSFDNLTDSDEAEMDVSSADDEESQPPRKKQAVEPAPDAVVAPKWSNPDPYTVLPPVDESQAKRKDVVKMIRKAKVAAQSKPEQTNAVTSNEDYISFGDLGLEQPPANAPRGPKGLRAQASDPALGSRKRTRDDEIIGGPSGKLDTRFNRDATIVDVWKSFPDQDPSPWVDRSSPPTFHLGTMLHNEVLNFYHWVKPKPFENIVREDLISRLQGLFQKRFSGCQLHAFGSFASGLYLPTADMDLVLLSRQFISSQKKTIGQKPRDIYAFSGYIKNCDIAIPGSIEPIAHARVPIIKFRDRLTGLRVDLSFDNTTGLAANRTFQLWKTQFPAMPVIVSVIKQFLLLRGLHEVPTGGLGGFSIICLVTSLLQHLPLGTAGLNLGGVLMDFFDFYGTQFDPRSVGIQLEPPGYFNKSSRDIYQADRKERLSITDPNNLDNDISGGTKEIPRIFASFADAFITLKQNLVSTAFKPPTEAKSLLSSIIGANYDSYESQRKRLDEVFKDDPRFAPYWPPPPPPPENSPPPPPPPQKKDPTVKQPEKPHAGPSKLSKKQSNAVDRAHRLKSLRPDIPNMPSLVTIEQAMELGGYESQSQMDRDINARERALKERDTG